MVKVQWSNRSPSEATWETEESMREQFPHLFNPVLLNPKTEPCLPQLTPNPNIINHHRLKPPPPFESPPPSPIEPPRSPGPNPHHHSPSATTVRHEISFEGFAGNLSDLGCFTVRLESVRRAVATSDLPVPRQTKPYLLLSRLSPIEPRRKNQRALGSFPSAAFGVARRQGKLGSSVFKLFWYNFRHFWRFSALDGRAAYTRCR
ncbi:hypothetical protein V6N13_061782 [Hibiscus sabdariffa]